MAAFVVTSVCLVATPPAGAAVTDLRLAGHGYGHGRGMSQWGALGYAVDHGWSGTQILDHYYGGTTTARLSDDPWQRVQLSALIGKPLIVFNDNGRLRTGASTANHRAIMVIRADETQFRVYSGASCGGPWQKLPSVTAPELVVTTSTPQTEDLRTLPQVCAVGGTNYYRGFFLAVHVPGTMWTVNVLNTETLLRGVVAREVSPSWAGLGSGRGAAAIRVQALAARSYLRSGETRFGSYATTCDSVCMAYSGAASRRSSSTVALRYEDPRIDQGVLDTARQVRRHKGTSTIARTEFSSSSGGWTAGVTFPAVSDAGDDITGNPNHNWSVTLTRAAVEAAFDRWYGRDLGTFAGLDVLSRNGLGAEGGRVLTAQARFSSGAVTFSGPTARLILGLRSDWFTPTVT